jgi:hypothetical protein
MSVAAVHGAESVQHSGFQAGLDKSGPRAPVPLQFSAKADEHHHTSPARSTVPPMQIADTFGRPLHRDSTSMILLSILLLPLGITALCSVMAWTERTLDRPTRKRFVPAAPDLAAIADRAVKVAP